MKKLGRWVLGRGCSKKLGTSLPGKGEPIRLGWFAESKRARLDFASSFRRKEAVIL